MSELSIICGYLLCAILDNWLLPQPL